MQKNKAIIHLDYIRDNVLLLKKYVKDSSFCAVVKADAYGHGAEAVAQSLNGYVNCFAVSLMEEGSRLRHAGIERDILVLTPPLSENEVVCGCMFDLIFTVGDIQDYRLIKNTCRKYSIRARCHLKVNTGMNRYGFSISGFQRFLRNSFDSSVVFTGIYSHFYRPDNKIVTERQYSLFRKFCSGAEDVFGQLQCHIAATGGVLASPEYSADMVRVGIGLYGYVPNGFNPTSVGLRPAMRVYATVSAAHGCTKGGAGYGNYPNPDKRVAIVRSGYADGFFRNGGIGNINNLCMDAFLTERFKEKYEEVCLLDNADEYARQHGTISYEILVRMGGRAERIYVEK